ncbi:MAG: S8 family serine peptidase [Thermoplasmatales archaeon]|nr:S8 family serine peptidase [Thermoplasmatales archaeon]
MNKKKFFGIGAVVLMILVAIVPALNGMQLSTKEENEKWNIAGAGRVNCNLEVIIDDFFLDEIKARTRGLGGKVMYGLGYTICAHTIEAWNPGYSGDIKVKLNLLAGDLASGTVLYSDEWIDTVDLDDDECISKIVSIGYLESNYEIAIDEERPVAGKKAFLEVEPLDGHESYPYDNIDDETVKHWMDVDYIPTEPEVEASAPHWYEKTYCVPEIPSLYNLTFFDGARILPNILKSDRMGWTGQIAKHLVMISANVTKILGVTAAFLILIKKDVINITEWMVDFIEWFSAAINGIFYGGLPDLIHDLIEYVLPAARRILIEAGIYTGVVVLLAQKLFNAIETAYNWTLDDPWSKPILIEGRVDRLLPSEVVTISCRGTFENYTAYEEGGTIRFEMLVTSDPMGEEQHTWNIHDCLVTVKGNRHADGTESIPLLSYAFANGSLYWHFVSPDGKSRERNIPFFLEKIKSLLKDRPLFIFLEKIFGRSEKTETSRDFDLDALVQRAMDEEKQYEPFEGEYKEYYPGAPSDPNVVYYGSEEVIVGFKSYVDVTEMDDVLGYPIVDWLVELNTVIVEIYGIDLEVFIEMAEQLEDVEYAELNFIYQTCFEPNDPLWDEQWGPKAINCPQAWDITKGGAAAKVAILDTGCNDHIDIYWGTNAVNYDFVNNDNNPNDDCYVKHGTHVAGIVGAVTDNTRGIAGVSRYAGAYVKVLDGNGAGYASTIAEGIIHAAQDDCYVDVISMSLGGYGLNTLLHVACDYAYYIRDTLIVAAAGNDGLSKLCYPARFGSVISVGAVDENLNLCSWSNHGSNLDVVAPGNNIISTYKVSGSDMYKKLSGTSMAAPHVAGVLALYFARYGYDKVLGKARLFSTAIPISGGGHGLVNAFDMVNSRERNCNFQGFLNFFPRLQQFFMALQLPT